MCINTLQEHFVTCVLLISLAVILQLKSLETESMLGYLNLEYAFMPLPTSMSFGVSAVATEYESETWTSLLRW